MLPKQRRYPWDRWFAIRRFRLYAGINFCCTPRSMAQQLYCAARRLGVDARVRTEGSTLVVTVRGPQRGRRRPGRKPQ